MSGTVGSTGPGYNLYVNTEGFWAIVEKGQLKIENRSRSFSIFYTHDKGQNTEMELKAGQKVSETLAVYTRPGEAMPPVRMTVRYCSKRY